MEEEYWKNKKNHDSSCKMILIKHDLRRSRTNVTSEANLVPLLNT